METAQWQALDTNNFNVFIRDLSSSMNINLKHMIEDMDKKSIQPVQKKNKKGKKKWTEYYIQGRNKRRKKNRGKTTLFFKTISDAAKNYGMARQTLRYKINHDMNSFSHKRLREATKDVKFEMCYERKNKLLESGGRDDEYFITISS